MALGKTSYVVLGMLSLGARTGYEIKSLVDVSTRFFWAASYGQIYPELSRLEELGLVRGERDPGDPRRRKSYELTADGERALREWLGSEEPLHLELRHEGLLKLFFSDALEPQEAARAVARMRAEHERIGAELRAIHPAAERKPSRSPLFTLEFGIAYQDFLVDWCRKLERQLAESATTAAGS